MVGVNTGLAGYGLGLMMAEVVDRVAVLRVVRDGELRTVTAIPAQLVAA